MQIAAADRGKSHPNEHFAGLRNRIRLLADNRLPLRNEFNCLHRRAPVPTVSHSTFETFAQAVHPLVDAVRGDRAESKHDARPFQRAARLRRQRLERHAARDGQPT